MKKQIMDDSKNVKFFEILELGTRLMLAFMIFGGIIGAIVNIAFSLK